MARQAMKQAASSKSLKKAAPTTTKKVAVAKARAKKPHTLMAKGMTDDGVTL